MHRLGSGRDVNVEVLIGGSLLAARIDHDTFQHRLARLIVVEVHLRLYDVKPRDSRHRGRIRNDTAGCALTRACVTGQHHTYQLRLARGLNVTRKYKRKNREGKDTQFANHKAVVLLGRR